LAGELILNDSPLFAVIGLLPPYELLRFEFRIVELFVAGIGDLPDLFMSFTLLDGRTLPFLAFKVDCVFKSFEGGFDFSMYKYYNL
jgi:hypothetical protein|tara:strand:+ start:2353 stop:2610 length:258 start_codon:yes stop_codon:yes gene_type:complete